MEYKYYNGNIPIRRKSLIEIRKHFIQHHTRAEATNIFGNGIGRIYWAGGSWNYRDPNGYVYELNENGRVKSNTRSIF